jgi:hypothetical protein
MQKKIKRKLKNIHKNMQDIWASLHSILAKSTFFYGFIVDRPRTLQLELWHHQRSLHATRASRFYQVSSDTGHCWFKASLRSARLQGLLEVGPARLLAAMLGDLGVSTLRSIKTVTQFSSLFWASNQPCCLLQCSGTTLRVRLWRPLIFLVVPTCW